jgi:PAS domain S-box-containing protein
LAAVAAAQVVHGGAFIETEGSPVLIAIKTLGFALILVGLVGGVRQTAAAGAGFKFREPLEIAPAAAALLVGIAAFSASLKGGPREIRRLAVGALLLGGSELMTAAAPDTIIGVSFHQFSYSAHGLKFLGFVALASWLWSAVRYSVRTRFVAYFGALLVAVILALSTALIGVISNSVENGELNRVEAQVGNAVDDIEVAETLQLTQILETIALIPDVRDRIAQAGQARSLAAEIDALDIGDPDFIVVDPATGVPAAAGDGPFLPTSAGTAREFPEKLREDTVVTVVGSEVVKEARRSGAAASPVKVGDYVAKVAAQEIQTADGRVGGVITIGEWLDALTVDDISSSVQAKASLIVGDRVFASTLPPAARRALKVSERIRSELATTDGPVREQRSLNNAAYFVGYQSIRSAGVDVPVATLVLATPAESLVASREGVTRILFLAAMIVGAVALALAWLSGRRITRPIQSLTATASAVREGDLTAKAVVSSPDEVGQLGETFNDMTSSLYQMTNDLLEAAREEHDLRTRIETIIESMADGLIAVDADKKVLAFNAEAEMLTGVLAADAIGQPVRDVLVAIDGEGARMSLPVYDLGAGSIGGVLIQHRSGEAIPVAVTSAVLRDEADAVSGAVAVLRDMTREREVERMKTEFLSNISHELRTPLTPIKGYAEMLQRKSLPENRVKQMVGGILESTARLERIVELLVDFSAMEAGRMAPRSGKVDISQILRDLAEETRERSETHEVVSDIEDDLPSVLGDPRLLRRSLEEILDNAVKFSPDGGRIRLQARQGPNGNTGHSGHTVEVVVSDEGIGISEADLTKIFSDFHQLDGSETRTFGGLGLGLAFVRRIVEVHDGVIEVDSTLDSGTTLTITIPAARAAEDED